MKKIKQFQAVNVPNTHQTQSEVMVYALDEDGDLYVTDMFCHNGWIKMEKINEN